MTPFDLDDDVLLGQPARPARGPAALDPALPAEIFVPATPRAPVARARRLPRDEDVLATGAIVDKYRIDGLVGRGGFATVYKATHLLLGTRVALKLLRPTVLERQPALGAQLCAEARFAARIDHPNVVRVVDVTSHALTYIVMEHIDGASLAQRVHRGGPLPPAALLRVGLQVVAGLEAGLAQGLIHRDIKPANILLTRSGDVKIVDFGLARHVDASAVEPRPRGAMVVGTYGYMSPEQADDPEAVDFRADVYSLGVTLFEAATGALPCPPGTPRPPELPRIEERVPGFPPAVSSLVAWMLAFRRDERPSSYASLHTAMTRVLAALGPTR
jgi:serine/threonine-protein kinase